MSTWFVLKMTLKSLNTSVNMLKTTPQIAQLLKNLPAMQETLLPSLSWEDPQEEGMATLSSILAWRIPVDQRSLAGYGPWSRKELDMTE